MGYDIFIDDTAIPIVTHSNPSDCAIIPHLTAPFNYPFNTPNFSFLIIFSIFADWNIINIKLK